MIINPLIVTQTPVLPLTVVDQIRLWEMERNRLKPTPCKRKDNLHTCVCTDVL